MEKKPLSRRDFIKLTGTALGASLLAACAPQVVKETQIVNQVVTATPLPSKPPEPAVLDVWYLSTIPDLTTEWNPADPENAAFKAEWYWGGWARKVWLPWLAKHPGISLNITGHGWDWDLRQNQLMAMAAGTIMDTVIGEQYCNEFTQLGIYSGIKPEVAAKFADGAVRGATSADGKVSGLPAISGAQALFINLDLWQKAGLDPAKLPTTWDELVTGCQAISKINKSDVYGNTAYFSLYTNDSGVGMRVLHWFNQNGCPLGSDLGVPSANAEKAVDTFLFHNKLLWTSTDALIFQPDGEAGAGKLFNDGAIAIKPGWSNDGTAVAEGTVNAEAIEFPLPPGGKPSSIVTGNVLHSPLKGGKHPDLAIALVEEALSDEEGQIFFADQAGIFIPALKSLLEQADTYDKLNGFKTETAKKIARVTMKVLLKAGGPMPGWPKNGQQCSQAWADSYVRIYKQNMNAADIKTELDALQAKLESLVAKTG